jgi:hypothetical protein
MAGPVGGNLSLRGPDGGIRSAWSGTATGIGLLGGSGTAATGAGGRSGLRGLRGIGLYAIGLLFSGEGNRVDNDRLEADAGE